MSNEYALTVTFINQLPDAASQEIQKLSVGEAAALIDSVPTRASVNVFRYLIPWQAARILESVSVSKAASIIRELSFEDAITLSRRVSLDNREKILDAIPARHAARLRRAVAYPIHQVGAWVDPDIPRLRPEDSAGDALRVLQGADNASHVFLESKDGESFVGLIPVSEVLKSDPEIDLDELPWTYSVPISNRATMEQLAFDERWDAFLHLPVVGRRGNLLGGFSRKALRLVLSAREGPARPTRGFVLTDTMSALSASVSEIARLLFAESASVPGSSSAEQEVTQGE